MLTVCLQATAGAHDSNGELYRVCVCVLNHCHHSNHTLMLSLVLKPRNR